MTEKKNKFNTLAAGIILAVLLPCIVYFLLYYSKFQNVQSTIFSYNILIGNLIPIIISHCILPNLVLFFIFNGIDWLRAAKGVLISTVIFTIALFAIKLIFRMI